MGSSFYARISHVYSRTSIGRNIPLAENKSSFKNYKNHSTPRLLKETKRKSKISSCGTNLNTLKNPQKMRKWSVNNFESIIFSWQTETRIEGCVGVFRRARCPEKI